MPRSSQPKRKDSAGGSPLLKNERIRELLKVQLMTFPNKELFEEEIANWERDLDPFPIQAIEWAFDNWRRNGRFFPVYGDIIDQCVSWEPSNKPKGACDAECKRKHNTGYGENPALGLHDITRLYELVCRKIEGEKRTKDQRFSDEEIEGLLVELDKMRGGAPQFRREIARHHAE